MKNMEKTRTDNPNLMLTAGEVIRSSLKQLMSGYDYTGLIHLEHPKEADHGDYATNIAMVLAKERRESPRELAQTIITAWEKQGLPEYIGKLEIAGPGFINIWLSEAALIKEANRFLDSESFEKSMNALGQGKTMVIDYSAPNIAKPFGIGHLRSTNIGQALYNLYHYLGWQTIGDNHLGDWGTQFGKLIVAITHWWDQDLKMITIADLEKLYVRFHQEAKENPELDEEARVWFKKLEDGDSKAKEIWQWCVDLSMAEFQRIYDILGVKIDYAYGESFYHFNSWMKQVLEDAKAKDLLEQSQGATVIKLKDSEVPAMLVKSDGGTTYLLRDLATIKFRMTNWKPDLIIYEVGGEQTLHFKQVFKVAQQLGYITKGMAVHTGHGLIRWADGKFSTREGKTIHMEEVIDETIKKARDLIAQTDKGLNEEDKEHIAQVVGIGGIKFNDLKQEIQKDIVFDWNKILSLDGYSGPYLQYTVARGLSVLRKNDREIGVFDPQSGYRFNADEIDLLRYFYQFPEVVIEAATSLAPHQLALYLFNLAQKFNLFYQKNRILPGATSQLPANTTAARLALTKITTQILQTGLNLLGIGVLEKM